MADNKLDRKARSAEDRELETRDTGMRVQQWKPPELLPEPRPEAGYSYRWVRLSTRGESDAMNVSSRLREGWEPVKASEHPEVMIPQESNPRFEDAIIYGGLILCKTPTELVHQRDEYYRQRAQGQMSAVDHNLMRENDDRMPLFNQRKSEVKFGPN